MSYNKKTNVYYKESNQLFNKLKKININESNQLFSKLFDFINISVDEDSCDIIVTCNTDITYRQHNKCYKDIYNL